MYFLFYDKNVKAASSWFIKSWPHMQTGVEGQIWLYSCIHLIIKSLQEVFWKRPLWTHLLTHSSRWLSPACPVDAGIHVSIYEQQFSPNLMELVWSRIKQCYPQKLFFLFLLESSSESSSLAFLIFLVLFSPILPINVSDWTKCLSFTLKS